MTNSCRMAVLLGVLALPVVSVAAENLQPAAESSRYAADEQAARDLLAKAVAFYREEGDKALAVFSRKGPFTVGNLYVFVVDAQGTLVASGGPSLMLVGQDIGVAVGDEARARLMRLSEGGKEAQVEEIEYPFSDWSLGGVVARKHSFFQRVGDHILAVGYYKARAESAQALSLLDQAAQAVASQPEATLQAINAHDKRYLQDDLYVFVVDLASKRFVAHGFNPRLVGSDFATLTSPDGKGIGQAMLDIALRQGHGEYDYQWRNPVTQQNEPKRAYLRRVGNHLVAVGYYLPQ
ncbi:cytochrome c [Pseudomonas linyingensis]|uniref:Cytochrome c n=1 Tax=Pseudomonas linyingensis TaxID=915471 RepID=A0A1H7AI05_9PSED|nr:cache domain-containing protein [Pseudomonas linyingensis]SEJ64556.1 cytochrome c [Pseudomonas linyingensis]